MAAPEVCKRVCAMSTTVKLDRLNIEVPWLIEQYRTHLHWGQFDQAMDCMEQASALAVAACRRELRQLGMAATEDELTKLLCERIRPHRNRGELEKTPQRARPTIPECPRPGRCRGAPYPRGEENSGGQMAGAGRRLCGRPHPI